MLILPPSEETKKRIDADLYQHPDKTKQDIAYLKEWIQKQPHLPQNIDDVMLERFLYGSKYSLEKCKKIIDNHFSFRSFVPAYFTGFDSTSPHIRDISKVCYRVVFPNCTPEGYRVTMYGFLNDDVSKYSSEASIQRDILFSLSILGMENPYGHVWIYDSRGFSMSHLANIMPHLSNIAAASKDVFPLRVKQVHFIYATSVLKKLLQIWLPIVKPKLKERVKYKNCVKSYKLYKSFDKIVKIIYVHTDDLSTMYKIIPQEIFPSDFGGKSPSIRELNGYIFPEKQFRDKAIAFLAQSVYALQEHLESTKDWLTEVLSMKTDESKRSGDSKRNELFGVDGSFKTLKID